VCALRDPKDIYAKAKAGLIKEFTGISAPYEAPEKPDLAINSAREDAAAAAKHVFALIEEKGIL